MLPCAPSIAQQKNASNTAKYMKRTGPQCIMTTPSISDGNKRVRCCDIPDRGQFTCLIAASQNQINTKRRATHHNGTTPFPTAFDLPPHT